MQHVVGLLIKSSFKLDQKKQLENVLHSDEWQKIRLPSIALECLLSNSAISSLCSSFKNATSSSWAFFISDNCLKTNKRMLRPLRQQDSFQKSKLIKLSTSQTIRLVLADWHLVKHRKTMNATLLNTRKLSKPNHKLSCLVPLSPVVAAFHGLVLCVFQGLKWFRKYKLGR